MRTLSDCLGDMLLRRIEDREIEYLLTRQARDDSDRLASALATLNLERLEISVDDRAADFADNASRLVRLADPATTIRQVRSPVVPRLATAGLAAVLIVGLAGVAEAGDAAAPGDALYGLDRALEQVGINDGGIDERLNEAQTLADHGKSSEALAHLAQALDTSSPNAADALEAAAERFGANDNPSQAVLEDVAAMLHWMANTQESGRDFGQGVAERARDIGAGHDNAPAAKPANPANDSDSGSAGKPDRPVDDDGSTDSGNGSSGSSGNSGNGDGSNTGGEGGKGGGNGPPGGSPPGQRTP